MLGTHKSFHQAVKYGRQISHYITRVNWAWNKNFYEGSKTENWFDTGFQKPIWNRFSILENRFVKKRVLTSLSCQ